MCATSRRPPKEAPLHAHGASSDEDVAASDTNPLCAYVWKTTVDPFVGRTYVRVYAGVLASDGRIWNDKKGAEERTGTVHVARGKEQMAVKQLHAGDIGTLTKLNVTATTDSLGERGHPLQVDPPSYPTALYSVAVNPRTMADSTKMGRRRSCARKT